MAPVAADPGPHVRRRSTPRSAPSRLWPGRSSRTRSPRRRRPSTPSSRTSPRISTFLRHNAALFADLRPGVHALERELAADRRGAGDRCAGPARRAVAERPARAHGASRWSGSRPNPDVQGGISRATQTLNYLDSHASVHRAGAVGLQLRDPPLPQRGEHSSASATESVDRPAVPGHVEPRWAQQRDEPGVRTRQQGGKRDELRGVRRARTSSTRTPTRTPRRPASARASARRATRPTSRARW